MPVAEILATTLAESLAVEAIFNGVRRMFAMGPRYGAQGYNDIFGGVMPASAVILHAVPASGTLPDGRTWTSGDGNTPSTFGSGDVDASNPTPTDGMGNNRLDDRAGWSGGPAPTDAEVNSDWDQIWTSIQTFLTRFGIAILGAVLILAALWLMAQGAKAQGGTINVTLKTPPSDAPRIPVVKAEVVKPTSSARGSGSALPVRRLPAPSRTALKGD